MGENTRIEWADHTFNVWAGCTKVSPACVNCYAVRTAARLGVEWGAVARRRFASESYWKQPLTWNRKAEAEGERRRVFCASLADVFEQLPEWHPDRGAMWDARERLWELIYATPALDWLLLTKRPENVRTMVPPTWWGQRFPDNVWLGTTAETQAYADARIPYLLQAKAPVRFLSCEPLLGPLDITPFLYRCPRNCPDGDCCMGDCMTPSGLHWIIAGGESGPKARPSHPDWFRSLRDQCQAAGVPFLFKQWGEYGPVQEKPYPVTRVSGDDVIGLGRIGKAAAGRVLDGREWNAIPEAANAAL